MDSEFKSKIKNALEKDRNQIQHELEDFAKKDNVVEGDYDSMMPNYGNTEDENAQEVTEYERNISLEHKLETKLLEINKALKRLEKDTYGICVQCKKEIPRERLEAIPSTQTCISCGSDSTKASEL